jgi:RNA 2',3'-cyclic 3'-phosphodiesterase
MRTFIAIDLDAALKVKLLDLVGTLKRKDADVRWVRPQGLHLTLKFLGEVGPTSLPAVAEAVRKAAVEGRAFPLVLHGTGTFPGGSRPRVLWAGIQEVPELMALQEAVEGGLEKEGYPREARPFHPHLTLGRVNGPSRVAEVVRELDKCRESVFGEMTVRKVAMFESVLKPQGAEYRIAEEFALA